MVLIERALRVGTHFNVGATLATAAWVLWSGWEIVNAPPMLDAQPGPSTATAGASCECRVERPPVMTHTQGDEHLAQARGFGAAQP